MFSPIIFTEPCSDLSTPVNIQRKIIETINAKLAANPRQGFCFIGSPGTGKSYLMREIRTAVRTAFDRNQQWITHLPPGDPEIELLAYSKSTVSDIVTLSGWQRAHVERIAMSSTINREDGYDDAKEKIELKRPFNLFSEDFIRGIAEGNERASSFLKLKKPYPFHSLHLFMDEFDSQPTKSTFAQDNLQLFVNSCYRYAPRICEGNEADFLQLVVSMNKSWKEFGQAYGMHVARRIHEMCVIIDFNTGKIDEPAPDPNMPDDIDRLLAKELEGLI